MEDNFREYIASDEPINTEFFFYSRVARSYCYNVHENKKILIKIDNTRPVHRSKGAGDVNAPSFSFFKIKSGGFGIRIAFPSTFAHPNAQTLSKIFRIYTCSIVHVYLMKLYV